MSLIEHELPQSIEVDGVIYKKDTNGYIREDVYDVQDVKRGLCMLSFPSNFIFKVNLTEFAHVYKMRNENTHANPEVKQLCMMCAQLIHEACDLFDTQLLLDIKN